MKIEINKLYHYIFGDWANLDKEINIDLAPDLKENRTNKRKSKINDFFAISKKDLRPTIRAFKNVLLEKILYNNNTDVVERYDLPNKEDIDSQLDDLEQRYGLIKEDKQNISPQARDMFHIYFYVAKLIADIYEHNGDPYNSTAFTHAYKMLVLFGDDINHCFRNIDKYLKAHNYWNISQHPLHDALIYELPRIEDDKINLNNWRTFIQKIGPKAFKLFNMAPAIEQRLNGNCPKDLVEARESALNIRFKKANEFPDLADLFINFNLHETLFDKALDLAQKRKKKDNLPNIVTHLSQFPGYHLVKLPIDDPNAYVLGHLTNCCQSIGGHAEQCVIDGLTKENNGFYVLLKSKVKTQKEIKEESPFLDGKINYKKYEIVGQCYAWLSQQGNLVIDSWENRSPERDDEVIVHLLQKFSQTITHQNDTTINRVMIGNGGKTPAGLKYRVDNNPEVPKEGKDYYDSRFQSVIYCNEEFKKIFISKLKSIIEERLTHVNIFDKDKLIQWIIDSCHSENQANLIISNLTLDNLHFLCEMTFPQYIEMRNLSFDTILLLMKENMLTKDNVDILLANVSESKKIGEALVCYKKDNFNIDIIMQSELDENSKDLILALSLFKEAKLDNNIQFIKAIVKIINSHEIKQSQAATKLINSYNILKEVGLENSSAFFAILIEFLHHGYDIESYAPKLVTAYSILKNAKLNHDDLIMLSNWEKNKLDKQESKSCHEKNDDVMDLKSVITKYVNSLSVAKAYLSLKHAGLEKDDYIRSVVLTCNAYKLNQAAKAIILLKHANLENDRDICDTVMMDYRPIRMANAFVSLKNANIEKKTNDDNYEFQTITRILRSSVYPDTTAKAIVRLKAHYELNYYLLRQIENCDGLAYDFINSLITLKKAGLDHDEKVMKTLKSFKWDLNEIAKSIVLFKEAKCEIDDALFRKIMTNYGFRVRVSKIIIQLKTAKLKNENLIQSLILNRESSNPILEERIVDLIKAFSLFEHSSYSEDVCVRERIINYFPAADLMLALTKLSDSPCKDNEGIKTAILESIHPLDTLKKCLALTITQHHDTSSPFGLFTQPVTTVIKKVCSTKMASISTTIPMS